MTEIELRQSLVDCMRSWVGAVKGSSVHATIINIYNQYKPRGEYTMTLNDPWCAATVSAAAAYCGLADIIPMSASCGRMINKFNSMGDFVQVTGWVPTMGDIIFYDWDEVTDADHVGVVAEVFTDGTFDVIEGNMGNKVGIRHVRVNSMQIFGYGCPDYSAKADGVQSTVPVASYKHPYYQLSNVDKKTIKTFPILKNGSTGIFVKVLQAFLNIYGNEDLTIDGEFGPKTLSGVKRWQRSKTLEVDGEVGKDTWSSFFV